MDKKSSVTLIAIGDEILLGQTLDTNSHFISDKLSRIGLPLRRIFTVPDRQEEILAVLEQAVNISEIVIATGGLGPTSDDLTRPVISEFFQSELVFREDLFERIRQRYFLRGIEIPRSVRVLAQFPKDAEPIPNEFGTAPGIFFRRAGLLFFSIPGVPREMMGMMDNFIVPFLISEKRGRPFQFRLIRTAGLGESNISELIGDWPFPEVKLAYLPKYGCVDLRLDALSDSTDKTERLLDEAEQFLLQKISPFVYARGEVELASVVGERLRRNHWRLAVAESCTGGLLASIITDIPGASDYFDCGFITYSNQAKTDMLDLPQEIIQKHGAVSPEAARLMAEGAKKRAGADFALSITGIAGPSGGTPEKPVGTVFIGIATPEDTEVRKFNFRDDRVMNRKRAAFAALILLFQTLKDFSSKNG